MHKLVEVSLGGKWNLAPIPVQPQRILDIGTGTGIWAIEMGMIPNILTRIEYCGYRQLMIGSGDKYPRTEVRGQRLWCDFIKNSDSSLAA